MSSRKQPALKLTADGKTKRFRELPENYVALRKLVEKFFKSSDFVIKYTDDTGDEINVSDDEDLFSAYDWLNGQAPQDLKFTVSKKQGQASMEAKELIEPMQALSVQPKKAPVYPATQKKVEAKPQTSSSDSSDSDEEQAKPKSGIVHDACGIPGVTAGGNVKQQKKAIRKMIKQSMKAHSRELIQSILQEEQDKNEPQIEEKKANETGDASQVVHPHVECDGCGVCPIVGPRYKCTVKKNFDFCASCEATKDHPHAFLKITKPGQAPRAMFTVINENMPGEADLDFNVEQTEDKPWKRGGRGRFGCGGGFGGRKHCFGKGMMMDEEFLKQQAEAFGMQFCEGDPQVMKKKIGWFMRQMFKGKKGFDADFTPGSPFDADKGVRRNPKRAIIISSPNKPVPGCPGDELTVSVTYKNCGNWPYRPGFHLETVVSNETKDVFETVKIPLEEVASMANFTVKVPIKIKADAQTSACSGQDHYKFVVGVTNTSGEPVGVACHIPVKVIPKIDESALYDKVMQLMALGASGTADKEPFSFEEAIQALKEADYTVEMAFALLKQKEVNGAKEE